MKSSIVRRSSRIRLFFCGTIVMTALIADRQVASAQPASDALITQPPDETELVALAGNPRPEANAPNDRGPVALSFPMNHLMRQLRRPADRELVLEKYIGELRDRNSPDYHHWLSAGQVGQRYGLSQHDISAIAA